MRSTPWFLPAPIAKACPTKKPCAGSPKRVELSLTPSSSGLSSPSRRQRCPPYSPPLAHRFPPPCRPTAKASAGKLVWNQVFTLENFPGFPLYFYARFFPYVGRKDRTGFRRACLPQRQGWGSVFPEDFHPPSRLTHASRIWQADELREGG